MTTLKAKSGTPSDVQVFSRALLNSFILIVALAVIALILRVLLKPMIAAVQVEETVTTTLSQLLILVLPYLAYITSGSSLREYAKSNLAKAIGMALSATLILYLLVTVGQYFLTIGAFTEASSLEMTLVEAEGGVLVDAIVEGGAADIAMLAMLEIQRCEELRDLGVLMGKGGLYGNVFRIKPPMCWSMEDADYMCDALDIALAKL